MLSFFFPIGTSNPATGPLASAELLKPPVPADIATPPSSSILGPVLTPLRATGIGGNFLGVPGTLRSFWAFSAGLDPGTRTFFFFWVGFCPMPGSVAFFISSLIFVYVPTVSNISLLKHTE